ncbi:hypothetical protein [Leisingera sp. M658]|uniref:hypothetical protein n=1 Tax=Leisingera sp. M658 TaxID=2867015 RepID=UPI0021A27E75|nr:hypothetical protein [Leisingera sp. M658]UWQ77374.1 hypothetical protein K3724_22830 [Leisingera sp. M658]
MQAIRLPARGYEGAPDWDDLRRDFCGLGGLLDMPADELKRRAAGRLAMLAVPYAGLNLGRELAADQAANWKAQLLPEIVSISPVLDAQLMLDCGVRSSALADAGDDWRALVRNHLRLCDVVIIPPIEGWDQAQDVFQAAAAALNSNKHVFIIREGRGK